ncbi:Ras-related protein Rab-4B, partial [Trichinella patagoniensis]
LNLCFVYCIKYIVLFNSRIVCHCNLRFLNNLTCRRHIIICLNFLLLGTRELASPVYFTNFWKINETKLVISLRLHFQVQCRVFVYFSFSFLLINLLNYLFGKKIFFQVKQDTAHTIGIEFGSKVVKIQDRSIKLQVWDTAGQERFRSLTKNYYNGAACALLVYDITCRQSFNAIAQWLSDARSLASPQIIVILIGNKKDLEDRREVTFMEGSQFAQENGMLFLETSALTGENIEETFLRCARSILTKIESGELDPNRVGYGIQFGHVEMKPIKSDRSNVHGRCNSCST